MKRLLLLYLFIPTALCSQTLVKNVTDEFTNKKVQETSWEVLSRGPKMYTYLRVRKVDSTTLLNLKAMIGFGAFSTPSVFAMDEGADFMIKLGDSSIVKLHNLKYEITCRGCGAIGLSGSDAQGVSLSFVIDNAGLSELRTKKISKIRLYTTDGFVEQDIKEKFADILKKELALIK